jgi:hypothetical protein
MLLEQLQALQVDPHQVVLAVAAVEVEAEALPETVKALGDVNLEKSIYRHG